MLRLHPFGNDVEDLYISPMLGMRISPKTEIGVGVSYRHRKDRRSSGTSLTSEDYGINLFTRYRITSLFFLEADYEYLDYEVFRSDLSSDRESFSGVFAGGGLSSPITNNASTYLSVLYNFSYNEPDSPYDDQWIVRFGLGIGF